MDVTRTSDIRPMLVRFKDDEKEVYEFKHAIIHGIENKDDGKLLSLICGYSDINDFIMVYTNILVECYHFLQENYEDDTDFQVLNTLKDYTLNIFDAIEKGEFSNLETVREEI